jgi:phosphoribosyl-ATP pyrophosphohydrolase
MALSGNLRTMLPGDLLQWLSLGQKTGTLVVSNSRVEKKIFFRNGRVISSASNDPREYLGQFLMSHGYITEPELKKAMEVQQQSRILLGKILVMIDVITEPELQRFMRLKAEEEIYDIFLWNDGDFYFVDDELPQMEMIPLQVDVTGIIMEGTRRVDEWARIREVIANEAVIPLLLKEVDYTDLEEVEEPIVRAIDGRRSIAELILESRSSAFTVSSTVSALVRHSPTQKLKKIVEEQVEIAPVPRPSADFNEDDEILSLLNGAQNALRQRDFEKTQRLLRAAQNLDPTHPKIRSAIKGAETVIMGELRNQGLTDNKVPKVAKALEEITQMNFTPNEGFILSRINGTWDIGSLIKISPIRETDAMLIFYKLWREGIIALD